MVRKIDFFFFNIYDVDSKGNVCARLFFSRMNTFQVSRLYIGRCSVIVNLKTRFSRNHFSGNCGHDNSKTIDPIDLKFFELT